MRVLMLPWNYLPNKGGLETCVFNITKRLVKKDIKLVIVTGKDTNSDKRIERINGIPIFRIYPNYLSWSSNYTTCHPLSIICGLIINLPCIFSLLKVIKSFRIDIINLHYPAIAAIYVLLIAKILKIKVIVSLHGELTQGVHYGTMFERRLFKTLLKKADIITACSQDLLKNALCLYPNIKDKSQVILNGVNLEEFNFNFDRNSRKRYILAMGSFQSRKGFDLLLIAFSYLIEKDYDIDLIIAGDGMEKANLQKLARLLKIEDRISFCGFATGKEKIKLFKECECFILPSRIEPFGIVNLEAMAAGKAIVATKTGGVPEIIKDGFNGILVEPYNDKALAEGMIRLLDDKELRDRLGKNGRKMAEDPRFSWDNITEQYIDIYRKVVCRNDA